jgi:hypothetical protein
MDEKAGASNQQHAQRLSTAGKALAVFLIGLCFIVLAGWLILLGRGLLALMRWIPN